MLKNISGFPEFLPKEQIAFNKIIDIIRTEFELHGFIPLDTPAVEKISTLLSKGHDEGEIYGLHRLSNDGHSKEKDLALRFDLTIPLARYVAQHYGKLTFPYRRYHIAPVWRGERPQSGRYRQFYQCDIDIIGNEELPLIYEAEVLSLVYNVLIKIGLKRFIVKINTRFLLTGLIKSFGITNEAIPSIIRVIDKVEKITRESLINEFLKYGLKDTHINFLFNLITTRMNNSEWLDYLPEICTHQEFLKGLVELKELILMLQLFNIPNEFIQITPSLSRGFNYYTGTIAEVLLLDYPELGSIGGGGRYDNLAGNFTNKQLPGVGFSIGLSRLIPKLIESGIIEANEESTAIVLVTVQNYNLVKKYIEITKLLWENNINSEIYLLKKPLSSQMKYANKKGFKFVIIANDSELENKKVILRSLIDGQQSIVSVQEAIDTILSFLQNP